MKLPDDRPQLVCGTINKARIMLFRPNYCANCGDKVERSEWGLLTSRRFCAVCDSEFKGQDLIPKAVVAIGLLAGVVGVGAYMRSAPERPQAAGFRQPVTRPTSPASAQTDPRPGLTPSQQPAQAPRDISPQAKLAPPVPRVEAEDVYICGAETKKGTPCSRRVKGNSRCFQHKGMPAMLPADKLKVG